MQIDQVLTGGLIMTGIESMEITSANTSSGSYERAGTSDRFDAFIIGDSVETGLFPTNTLEQAVSIT